MKFQPFDTYGMDDDEVLLLKETCDALASAYKTEFVNLTHRKDLSPLFKDLQGNIEAKPQRSLKSRRMAW